MIHDSNDDRDVKISAILFSYRTAIHSSTKFTPVFFYNREPRLALDLQLKQSRESTDGIHQDVKQEQLLHDVEVLVNLKQRYTTIAKQNIVKAQQRQKTNYDKWKQHIFDMFMPKRSSPFENQQARQSQRREV